MRLIDADALFKDICDSINEMTKIRIMVDGQWLWAKLNDALENAPTIEPEREKGHWVKDGHHIECNKCGTYMCDTDREGDPIPMSFCPNCGTPMERGVWYENAFD